MNLIPGVVREDYSDYVLYFVENLSDELKQEIRNRLVAVCHGADQAQSPLKIYSYKETVKEFVKRYKCEDCGTELPELRWLPEVQSVVRNFDSCPSSGHPR